MPSPGAKSWTLGLIGVSLLGLLIWLFGDLVLVRGQAPLESAERRAAAIAALVLVWLVAQAIVARRLARRARSPHQGWDLPHSDHSGHAKATAADEIELLEGRFRDVLRLLKGRNARRALGRSPADLPWYLLMGPPDSGKTTALASSGLSFPLSEALLEPTGRRTGDLRSCDWWITKDAVVLETAGRYTTQDSYQQVDRIGWQAVLRLLKARRPQQPINGVLLAISVTDVLQQSTKTREALAETFTQRLRELGDALGIRVPVYVVVTKLDLVAGFADIFGDLAAEERDQLWGLPLSLDSPDAGPKPAEQLRDGLSELLDRLSKRAMARLESETDPAKAASIFAFPQQFAALRAPLAALVLHLLGSGYGRSAPILRGLYFTSATQVGTPIDRVRFNVAASCGLVGSQPHPHQGPAYSYFVARLLRDVVFPEACLAGVDRHALRRRSGRRAVALSSLLVLCAMAAAIGTATYLRDSSKLSATERAVEVLERELAALSPDERDPVAMLPLLDRARALSASDTAALPLLRISSALGLDLYSDIGAAAQDAYHRILRKTLLPLVLVRLEDQIRSSAGDPELLFDVLRIYLQLEDTSRYEGDMVRYWVGRDWDLGLLQDRAGERQREALKDHLQALLEEPPAPLPFALDTALIGEARRILTRESSAERLYDRLKREGVGSGFADLTVSDAAGDFARLVFDRRSGRPLSEGIPALYTFDGYHYGMDAKLKELIAAMADEAWVLGIESELEVGSDSARRLRGDVLQLYLRDYVAVWDALLQDMDLIAPRDLRHAAEIARMLADREQSPLRRLLLAAMAQTSLDRPAERDQPAAAPAGQDPGSRFRERVDRYFSEDRSGAAGMLSVAPEAYVSRRFRWLPELMRAEQGQAAPFERAQAALDRASLLLESMSAAASSGRGALAASEASEISDLKKAAEDLPAPVAALLTTLSQDSADIVSSDAHAHLNRLWTAEILPFCRRSINDRYPFDRTSSREVTLRDFGHLLAPGGLLDTFFQEHLSPLVETSSRPWRWKEDSGGFADEALDQFQQAAAIRDAFFQGQNPLPVVRQELVPTSLDDQTSEVRIDLGGQVLAYGHGTAESRLLIWPSKIAPGHASVELVDRLGMRPGLRFSGPWAWLRLLDASKLGATGEPGRYRMRLALDEHRAELEIRAEGLGGPFLIEQLRGFRCVDRL